MAEQTIELLIDEAQTKVQKAFNSLNDSLMREVAEMRAAAESSGGGVKPADLLAIMNQLSGAFSQVELLNLLVELASKHAPRVLLLIRKGANVHGWSGSGFEDAFLTGSMKKVKWSIEDYPELARVIHQKKPLVANFSDLSDISDQITQFDGYMPFKSSFFPLTVKNKAAAVLYIDSGSQPHLEGQELIEFYSYLVGVELTLVTSKLKAPKEDTNPVAARPQAPQPAAPKQVAPAAPTPVEAPEPAEPEVSPLRAVVISEIEPTEDSFEASDDTFEPPPAPTFELPPEPPSVSPAADEDPSVKKARRVARVLVSDLKLYNEKIVESARKSGNLYSKLKDDLDRSYKHYQERVSGLLGSSDVNYFKEELIKQLGDGDPANLGPLPF